MVPGGTKNHHQPTTRFDLPTDRPTPPPSQASNPSSCFFATLGSRRTELCAERNRSMGEGRRSDLGRRSMVSKSSQHLPLWAENKGCTWRAETRIITRLRQTRHRHVHFLCWYGSFWGGRTTCNVRAPCTVACEASGRAGHRRSHRSMAELRAPQPAPRFGSFLAPALAPKSPKHPWFVADN